MSRPNPNLPPSPQLTPKRPSLRPPNVQKDIYHTCQNQLPPPNDDSQSQQDKNFHLFTQLPVEIQNLIWTHAAWNWASHNLHVQHSPTPRPKSPKIQVDLFAERDHGFKLPSLIWTCSAARNATLDYLLVLGVTAGWKLDDARAAKREGNVWMFLGEDAWPKEDMDNEWIILLAYAIRIQDFRIPGLQERLDEEDQRIREQQADIDELARRWEAFESGKLEEELEEMGIGEYPNVKCGEFFFLPVFPERRSLGLARGQKSFGFD